MTYHEKTEVTFQQLLNRRLSRRGFISGSTALGSAALIPGVSFANDAKMREIGFSFSPVAQGLDQHLSLPEGYQFQVVKRWGDPLNSSGPEFSPLAQTGETQAQQFGFNNDFVGFLPLPIGSTNSEHGLLVVNHEHTKARMMHSGVKRDNQLNKTQTEVDIMAHGLSVLEVKLHDGNWQSVKDSKYNRRITPFTEMTITGPAQGDQLMQTVLSRDGVLCHGTYGNCAGGVTPWGTVLTAEENIDKYFTGDIKGNPNKDNYQRMGFSGEDEKSWSRHFPRWDLNKNPNEGNHVGWIVEIDPYNPDSIPKKLTALGRFKHEGCNIAINPDGYVVGYSGDDEKFEYVYKFVSKQKYQQGDSAAARAHNMKLLQAGTLFVAKFSDTGDLKWLPLEYGQGPLTKENGFRSQADIAINTRKAADLLHATPMDRPEDIDINPVNDKVYVMLTKNDERDKSQLNGPNPRSHNRGGQIVELIPPNGDHAADVFRWEMFILAGDPKKVTAYYHPETQDDGWFAAPDNCAFDRFGNVWVTTDGAEDFGVADGVWCVTSEGRYRGYSRRFMRAPIGAEVCGPYFSPDNKTFFCAIQHPGNDSNFDKPDTRWPDYDPSLPPRPALIAITRKDRKIIGT